MDYLEAIILGIVEGVTEFLPISSTGHLTITEKVLGLPVADPSVTAYTAVIQIGAILAVLVYFAKDIWGIITGWVTGLTDKSKRGNQYRMGWNVILGSLPIGIVGLAAKGVIETSLRSLWVVAVALILWSAVMWWAEHTARQERGETAVTIKDALLIGAVQCIALIPGVSRSGATISAGLMLGIDRVTATKLSFYLAIPALLAAGLLELKSVFIGNKIGLGPAAVGTLVAFIVAYAAIAWLLKFVANNSITAFVSYRVVLGTILLVALGTQLITAT